MFWMCDTRFRLFEFGVLSNPFLNLTFSPICHMAREALTSDIGGYSWETIPYWSVVCILTRLSRDWRRNFIHWEFLEMSVSCSAWKTNCVVTATSLFIRSSLIGLSFSWTVILQIPVLHIRSFYSVADYLLFCCVVVVHYIWWCSGRAREASRWSRTSLCKMPGAFNLLATYSSSTSNC